jgi:hypothetical protein
MLLDQSTEKRMERSLKIAGDGAKRRVEAPSPLQCSYDGAIIADGASD